MVEYRYYWFTIKDDLKFDKNLANLQTVSVTELRRAIGLYLFNLEKRNELDVIPKFLKNIKERTISESPPNTPESDIWLEGQMDSVDEPKGLVPKLEEALAIVLESQLDDAVEKYIGPNYKISDKGETETSLIKNLYLDVDDTSWKVEDIVDKSLHPKFRQDPFQHSDSELSSQQQRVINEDTDDPIILDADNMKEAYDKDSIKIIGKKMKPNQGQLVIQFEIDFMDTEIHKKRLRAIFPQQKILFNAEQYTISSKAPSYGLDLERAKGQYWGKERGEFTHKPVKPKKSEGSVLEESENWLNMPMTEELHDSFFKLIGEGAREGLSEWAKSTELPIPEYYLTGTTGWKGISSTVQFHDVEDSRSGNIKERRIPMIPKIETEYILSGDIQEAFASFWQKIELEVEDKIKQEELTKWKKEHAANLKEKVQEYKSNIQMETLDAISKKSITAFMNDKVSDADIENFLERLWTTDNLYNQFIKSGMPLSLTSLGNYTITMTIDKKVGEEPKVKLEWSYRQDQELNVRFLISTVGKRGLYRKKFKFGKGSPKKATPISAEGLETDPKLKDERKQSSLGYNQYRDFLAKFATSRYGKLKKVINTLKGVE